MSTTNMTEVLVGAVVLAGAIGFAVYAGQTAGISRGGETYALNASFRSLEGVTVGTDVRLAGVKIGAVTDVTLDVDTYRADTEFGISRGIEIPDDSAAVISSEGLPKHTSRKGPKEFLIAGGQIESLTKKDGACIGLSLSEPREGARSFTKRSRVRVRCDSRGTEIHRPPPVVRYGCSL